MKIIQYFSRFFGFLFSSRNLIDKNGGTSSPAAGAGAPAHNDEQTAALTHECKTRLCSLPWQKFTVSTQFDPPLAAPCRNFQPVWNAWDLAGLSLALQDIRNNLLNGSLKGSCIGCKDKPLASRAELVDLLEKEGLQAYNGNKMVDALQAAMDAPITTPPAHLTYRVAHTKDPRSFIASGVISIFEILSLVKKYDTAATCRLLDWGCGSGRLSQPIAERFPEIELTGCDIDSEAVDWCRTAIGRGDFRQIEPEPPTSFARAQFTAIIGFSIVTHLTRELQQRWIKELHELLAEDGIIVLTTHGSYAARIYGLSDRLDIEGIIDERIDDTLNDIAPAGYYRSTFQSRAWTEKTWGAYFDILEYIDGGAFGLQDIIVLKKKKPSES